VAFGAFKLPGASISLIARAEMFVGSGRRLGDLDDFPGDQFSQRVASVDNCEGAQRLLKGNRHEAPTSRS